MELTVRIEAKDLAEAINNLAKAISGAELSKSNKEQIKTGTKSKKTETEHKATENKPVETESRPEISLDSILSLAKICLKDVSKKESLKNLLSELGVKKVSAIPEDKIEYAYITLKEVA